MRNRRIHISAPDICALLLSCSLVACDRTPAASPAPDAPASTVRVPLPTTAPDPPPAPSAPPPPAPQQAGIARSQDGTLTLASQPIRAIHTHGGDEAKIGRFTLSARNTSARERRIELSKLEYRTGHSCDEPPTTVSARPKPQLLVPEADDDPRPPSTSGVVPPKSELRFSAQFDSVGAYYTHCDKFALVAWFVLDGKETVQLEVALHVEREDP
jgi:hypothetical protein